MKLNVCLAILVCGFISLSTQVVQAQTLKELQLVFVPHQFGEEGGDVMDNTALSAPCPLNQTCLTSVEGLIVIHQGAKKSDREVYVVDEEALARVAGDTYGKKNHETMLTALRTHMRLRGVKTATVPCHTVELVKELYWPKEEQTFEVKDLQGSTKKAIKYKSFTPVAVDDDYKSFLADLYNKGPAEATSFKGLFEPEVLAKMKYPSFNTPSLIINNPSRRTITQGDRGYFVALWSPESTRVYSFHFKDKWTSEHAKKVSTMSYEELKKHNHLYKSKNYSALKVKQQKKLEASVLNMLKKTKTTTVRVDLKTMCKIPSLFGVDPERLMISF